MLTYAGTDATNAPAVLPGEDGAGRAGSHAPRALSKRRRRRFTLVTYAHVCSRMLTYADVR